MPDVARLSILFALFGVLLACAASPDRTPQWVEAEDADFSGRQTFTWAEGLPQPPPTLLGTHIQNAIRQALLAKGHRESIESPDFRIDYEPVEQQVVERGKPITIGIGIGTWGRHVGGSVGTSVDVGDEDRVVQQIRIAIRALDGEGARELWVGSTAVLPPQPPADAVRKAVGELLAHFPDPA